MSMHQNTIPVHYGLRNRLGTAFAIVGAVLAVAVAVLIITLTGSGRTPTPTSPVQHATPPAFAPPTQGPGVTKPHGYLDPETGQMHGA
jgi:hypothetical protein